MTNPQLLTPGMAPKPRPLLSYASDELNDIAYRCDDHKVGGFIVTPDTVRLFAEGLRSLGREQADG